MLKKKNILVVCFMIHVVVAGAQELYRMPVGQQSRLSSFENLNGVKGRGGMTNHSAKGNAFEHLEAGESKELLNVTGAGMIQRMWITFNDRSPEMLRSLRLRIYWDGSIKAAVDVPVGDFFCAALGKPVAFQSALFSDPEGRSFNCYIPMPFKTGARVVITNESKTGLGLLFFDIDFITQPKAESDILYFHANWNRSQHGSIGKDFELLPKVSGRGRFIGVNVGVKVNGVYENSWWGEGEVKMYIDGDSPFPTINGTGAEDYIGTGWSEGTFSNAYQGCLIAGDKPNENLFSFYRFHVPDQIFFYKDIRVTIQEIGGFYAAVVDSLKKKGVPLQIVTSNYGWTNFYRSDDYSATSYFYLDKPVSDLPELQRVDDRLIQEINLP